MLYASMFQLLDQVPHRELMHQYMHLLGYLTIVPDVPLRLFLESLKEIQSHGDIQVAYTLEDGHFYLHGAATIRYETKISRGCLKVGHIEDVVVSPNHRRLGIAQTLIQQLLCSSSNKCYKVLLSCTEELSPLYEKCGFRQAGLTMERRFL